MSSLRHRTDGVQGPWIRPRDFEDPFQDAWNGSFNLLCARLRTSNRDASAGSAEEFDRIVGRTREAWPEADIWVRGDSGFAREALTRWCEDHDVEYVFGLDRNARLKRALEPGLERAICSSPTYGDFGLIGTKIARVQCGTFRLKLLKIGRWLSAPLAQMCSA